MSFVVGRALRAAGGAKLEKECNMVASQTSMSVTEGNSSSNRSPYRI